jgi:MFS family permease
MPEHSEVDVSPDVPRRFTAPFLFLFLELPFGAATGFAQLAVPFWLAKQGVSLADIGGVSAITSQPHALKILWVPLLDVGPWRRLWYIGSVVLTAVSLAAAILVPDPIHQLVLYTGLIVVSQVGAATSSAALEALMATTTRPTDKGAVGGWKMAGNLGGAGLLPALAIELIAQLSRPLAAIIYAAIVLGCGALALKVAEPAASTKLLEEAGSVGAAMWKRFVSIVRDLWVTIKSREGWTGLVICLSPVGTCALTNLFSAMAGDYQATDHTVELVNGVVGGIVSAVGCVIGGYVTDRLDRRVAYAISGGMTASVAFAMAALPKTPAMYLVGCMAYSFASGLAYAAFAGMVLEMVSHGQAVTTKYTLFVAASNQAINYVTLLDGKASEFRGSGVTGTLAFDGIISVIGIVVLLSLTLLLKGAAPPKPAPA